MQHDDTFSEADIDFAEDAFLLRAADPRKHVEPPRLSRIEVQPAGRIIAPGDRITFTVAVVGYDQHDRPIPCLGVAWAVTLGQIDEKGGFIAPDAEGACTVRASVGGLSSAVTMTVEKRGPGPEAAKAVRWRGAIPPQKWTTLLHEGADRHRHDSRTPAGSEPELAPPDSLTDAKVEQIRAALLELGLPDEVEQA